ncbi:MAG: hypothetical protein ACOZB3_11390 [Calditrichota bacterium]
MGFRRAVILSLIALVILLPAHILQAKERDEFGMGLTLGEPSGIHGQFFWSRKTALDVTAAWSFHDWFMTTADFQIYDYLLDSPDEWRWYYGGGAYLALPENEDGTFGVRVPVGIRYHFPHSYVDVWAEIDPALQLAPETEAEFQAGLGVTFWLW